MTEDYRQNRLLAALPPAEYEELAPALEPVSLDLGRILYEPPDPIPHVYFPTTCLISFIAELPDGSGAEVGLVGCEAMAGVEVILGAEQAVKVATVQGAGHALRLKAEQLRAAFARGGRLQAYLLRYTHALMTQISASVVCNIRHNIDQRLARWLLMYQDRVGADEFYLTHEFMANMLGIRRAGVSEVAKRLQQAGVVAYDRGRFRILNRPGLEAHVCECYRTVRAEFDRLYT
ncbi:MAG TPA: Crp/Fnr family transcriptional regulator [Pyrinomonadaceae bacterium]|jgi:CRP-like cAMP-binding protein